ncbi:hypothetical protein ACIQNU_26610 [Streptomyces sp. NPDC091292]|uniref:hypothetical protein n=1 Tax=Streptomyces sp. NPDC091292 TaxID=3365991 RepID=UPI0037F1FC82
MSQEAGPEQSGHELSTRVATEPTVPGRQGSPKGLLQQMEELMAALTADLSQLDADLQQSSGARRPSPDTTAAGDTAASGRAPETASGRGAGPDF